MGSDVLMFFHEPFSKVHVEAPATVVLPQPVTPPNKTNSQSSES
jgi:hypothetical protein